MLFVHVSMYQRLAKCITEIQFSRIIRLAIEYFRVSFVSMSRIIYKGNYTYDKNVAKRDRQQRAEWVNQMIHRIELNLLISSTHERLCILLVYFYSLTCIFAWQYYWVNYETSPEEIHVKFPGVWWLNLITGIHSLNYGPWKKELYRSQIVFIVYLTQLILDSTMSNQKRKERVWEKSKTERLTTLIIKKLKFYIDRRKEDSNPEDLDRTAEEIEEADHILKQMEIEQKNQLLHKLDETISDIDETEIIGDTEIIGGSGSKTEEIGKDEKTIKEEKLLETHYMDEETSPHEKVIFYKKNTRKYYLARCIQSMFYAMSRIALYPMLIGFWVTPNIISIAFLVFLFIVTNSRGKVFNKNASKVMWWYALFFCLYYMNIMLVNIDFLNNGNATLDNIKSSNIILLHLLIPIKRNEFTLKFVVFSLFVIGFL